MKIYQQLLPGHQNIGNCSSDLNSMLSMRMYVHWIGKTDGSARCLHDLLDADPSWTSELLMMLSGNVR
jgi:hypothetical protein